MSLRTDWIPGFLPLGVERTLDEGDRKVERDSSSNLSISLETKGSQRDQKKKKKKKVAQDRDAD